MKRKFIVCGISGWCMEIIFTGFRSAPDERKKLIGRTSVWMFPIYGLACLIGPLSSRLKKLNICIRGLIYTFFIFFGEFISGLFLTRHKMCPWDYSSAKYNIRGLIRLDYAPYWFCAGLIFEQLLNRMNSLSVIEKEK